MTLDAFVTPLFDAVLPEGLRTLGRVLVAILIVNGLMLAVAGWFLVGRQRLSALWTALADRLRTQWRPLALLAGALVANALLRDLTPELSLIVGWNVTGAIHALEGNLIVYIQTIEMPALTAYFGFMYVFGYVFLLTFPLLAYLALADPRPLRITAYAYTLNYVLGLLLYVMFVAYGPRNTIPDVVPLLYTTYPETILLTTEVNTNTNVFPSLHTSLSVTVALLAWMTREQYPNWLPIATVVAASITFSTMYLGIHWAIDVVAGIVLAVVSVWGAERIQEWTEKQEAATESAAETPSG